MFKALIYAPDYAEYRIKSCVMEYVIYGGYCMEKGVKSLKNYLQTVTGLKI